MKRLLRILSVILFSPFVVIGFIIATIGESYDYGYDLLVELKDKLNIG